VPSVNQAEEGGRIILGKRKLSSNPKKSSTAREAVNKKEVRFLITSSRFEEEERGREYG